ncbi:MAG: hypothetical protein A2176_07770 [Spirochaetes bacterium RBG_13_51_14]|nr:MAG: hypothetical protein A2176_07770 [Spirochaetes bacterium RBG_13_51_14]
MKKRTITIAVIVCLFATGGCSQQRGAASFDGIFEKLKKARGFSEVKRYYTGGTIDALDAAVGKGVISEVERLRILPLFNDKTTWEEVSKKVDGTRGVIRIRYTEHPVENMIGFDMDFRVVKEGGSWKIDLEDEIRRALSGRQRGSPADYIQRIKRRY